MVSPGPPDDLGSSSWEAMVDDLSAGLPQAVRLPSRLAVVAPVPSRTPTPALVSDDLAAIRRAAMRTAATARPWWQLDVQIHPGDCPQLPSDQAAAEWTTQGVSSSDGLVAYCHPRTTGLAGRAITLAIDAGLPVLLVYRDVHLEAEVRALCSDEERTLVVQVDSRSRLSDAIGHWVELHSREMRVGAVSRQQRVSRWAPLQVALLSAWLEIRSDAPAAAERCRTAGFSPDQLQAVVSSPERVAMLGVDRLWVLASALEVDASVHAPRTCTRLALDAAEEEALSAYRDALRLTPWMIDVLRREAIARRTQDEVAAFEAESRGTPNFAPSPIDLTTVEGWNRFFLELSQHG